MLDTEALRAFGEHELAPRPTLDTVRSGARRRRSRRRRGGAAVVTLMAVATLGLVWPDRTGQVIVAGRIALADVPEGMSARLINGVPVFIDRQGSRINALVARSTHLKGESIWWCPAEETFISPEHGEVWSRDGSVAFGPAPRGLDRIVPTATDDKPTLDLANVVPGSPAKASAPPSPVGREPGYCAEHVEPPRGSSHDPLFTGPLPYGDVNLALLARGTCATVRPSIADDVSRAHFTLTGCSEKGPLKVIAFRDQRPGLPWIALVRSIHDFGAIEAQSSQGGRFSMAVMSDPTTGFGVLVGTGATPSHLLVPDGSGGKVSAQVPDEPTTRCPLSVHSFELPPTEGESADGLPPAGTTTLSAAERVAAERNGRVTAVPGRSWTRDETGQITITPETIYAVEVKVKDLDACPATPALVNGTPLTFVYPI